jgi:hypothetical protein
LDNRRNENGIAYPFVSSFEQWIHKSWRKRGALTENNIDVVICEEDGARFWQGIVAVYS